MKEISKKTVIQGKNNKIKIMFIIDAIHGIKAGTETQLNLLIKNLDKNIYDITLLCLKETEWERTGSSVLNCKIKIFDIKRMTTPGIIFKLMGMVRYIKDTKPDIVMTFFRDSNMIGVIAARLAKTNVIISTRRDYGLWLDKRSYFLLRFANSLVHGIVANSKKVMELTCNKERVDSSKIHVIYNGIKFENLNSNSVGNNTIKNEIGIPIKNKVIGIVANLRPMKRYWTFLKAAKRVLNENPEVDFLIVGDGPLRSELVSLSSELGISNRVHFVGSQENVVPFLSIFDIGVNCSANEGLSNAIMEYMDYGIPCIVSRAGGNEELIENGVRGYTFELDNDQELSQLIISLSDDETNKTKFMNNAKKFVEDQLSVEKMIKEYNQYFLKMHSHQRI